MKERTRIPQPTLEKSEKLPAILKFSDMNLSESLLMGLQDLQFEEPTKIQAEAIPQILNGGDLIGIAQTGTGKTGAFVIPVMEKILQSERNGIKALILSPTRELATQIDEQIFAIGYHAGITSATVIGGSNFSEQARALKAGVDIIVATPGRLMDQNNVVSIDFSSLECLILDEADRMLDMGFLPDMKTIISWLPENRQTLLFSATMPKEIQKLAEKIMKNPGRVEIERSKASSSVEQRAYKLLSPQKITLVKKIFKDLDWDSCIIFTSTKRGTDELEKLLKKEGIKAVSIHGDRTQEERNRALQAFKNKEIPVIVATDVLARGIDIKGVSIILNYDVPNSTDDYIHRIGRTGRYDKTGIAITFVTRRDARNFSAIENLKENALKVIQVPESFDDESSFSWGDSSLEGTSGSNQADGAKPVAEQKKEQKERKEQKEQKEEKQARNRADKKEKKRTGKSSKSTKEREEKVRDDASSGSSSGKRESAKGSTAKGSAAKGSSVPNKSAKEEKVVIPPVLEVASKHNKRFKKPAKGIVGILKSFFQR
jgi:ATP-dependent RNA helicase RhlE